MIQMNERLTLHLGSVFKRSWHRLEKYTGGFMNEKCSHDLDLMCWIKERQSTPVAISSFGGISFDTERETALVCKECDLSCPWRYRNSRSGKMLNGKPCVDDTYAEIDRCVFHSDSDVCDQQSVSILFKDGTQGVFTTLSMSGIPGRDITVHGTDGCLQGCLETGEIVVHNYWEGTTQNISLGKTDSHGGADRFIVESFLNCITEGIQPISTVEAGVRASTIAFAADQSMKEQRKIVL